MAEAFEHHCTGPMGSEFHRIAVPPALPWTALQFRRAGGWRRFRRYCASYRPVAASDASTEALERSGMPRTPAGEEMMGFCDAPRRLRGLARNRPSGRFRPLPRGQPP